MKEHKKPILVTAAIIEKDGKFLIARRKKDSNLGGKWEFPGGKLEINETPEEALKRELYEEFEIVAEVKSLITENIHNYENRSIKLLGYRVEYISGDIKLNTHDQIVWVSLNQLDNYDFAEADLVIIKKLKNNWVV